MQTAGFKSAVSRAIPNMIIACDQRNMTLNDLIAPADTITAASDQYYNAADAFKTLTQNCGAKSSGKWSVTVKGIGDYVKNTANCTESGCQFN